MIYNEETRNLFSVSDDYYLVQSISGDFMLNKGIAFEFNRRFDINNKLQSIPNYLKRWDYNCLLEGRVLNLITKKKHFYKSTYDSIHKALVLMKHICIGNGIKKIAMPEIGCGFDGLSWSKTSEIIKDVFANTNIEILVCKRFDKV